jgi:hypothetical protein
VTGRQRRRRKQLLDNLKKKKRYWKLKEESLDRTLWITRFGRGYGPLLRQTKEFNMTVTNVFAQTIVAMLCSLASRIPAPFCLHSQISSKYVVTRSELHLVTPVISQETGINTKVVWDMTPCSLVQYHCRSKEKRSLQLQSTVIPDYTDSCS